MKLFERIINHMLRTIVGFGNIHFVLGEDDLLRIMYLHYKVSAH